MSGNELLVIVFGLFMGYWVVSRFGAGNKAGKEQARDRFGQDQELQRRREQAEREAEERHPQAEAPPPASWHEILNVPANADAQEIRRAYKNLMSQYHPDKVASLGPELRALCERKTKEINIAYDRAMAERRIARC